MPDISAATTCFLPLADHDQAPAAAPNGRRFRRFGRLSADGRVITYSERSLSEHKASQSHATAADGYLDHEIDTQAYGRPMSITGMGIGGGR